MALDFGVGTLDDAYTNRAAIDSLLEELNKVKNNPRAYTAEPQSWQRNANAPITPQSQRRVSLEPAGSNLQNLAASRGVTGTVVQQMPNTGAPVVRDVTKATMQANIAKALNDAVIAAKSPAAPGPLQPPAPPGANPLMRALSAAPTAFTLGMLLTELFSTSDEEVKVLKAAEANRKAAPSK